MAGQKTKPTSQSVNQYINAIEDQSLKQDCFTLIELMRQTTGAEPRMWGSSIVGFGTYHYKYASGHEGDSCLTGFAPRKGKISIYLMPGFDQSQDMVKKLGPYQAGKGCLYLKNLKDIDLAVLKQLIAQSVNYLQAAYKKPK